MSDEQLLRDAVRIALRGFGFTATSVATPPGPAQLQDVRRWVARARPATGLLLADVGQAPGLRAAVAVLGAIDLPWLLLTGAPPGPSWGAVLDAGGRHVISTSSTLEELSATLRWLARGQLPPTPDREEAVRAWHRTAEEQRRLARRLEALSAREMEVLVALHDGTSVRAIATRAGVTEGTVRSQVKSIFKKLAVTSQLQAVAAFRQANDWLAG